MFLECALYIKITINLFLKILAWYTQENYLPVYK